MPLLRVLTRIGVGLSVGAWGVLASSRYAHPRRVQTIPLQSFIASVPRDQGLSSLRPFGSKTGPAIKGSDYDCSRPIRLVIMTHVEMERLWRLVQEAKAEKSRPFEPGEESRPLTFITDHLPPEGWELGWRLVTAYREGHPVLFLNYSQNSLHVESLDLLESAEQPPTVDELANALKEKAAEEESTWLVDVPLANVKMAAAWAPAGETAVVRRAWDVEWKPGQPRPRFTDEAGAEAEFAIFRHLHDRLPPPTRPRRR